MEIMITNQQARVEFDQLLENTITAVANAAARMHGLDPDSELSVLLVDNQYIKRLNAIYRGQDVATDVLSFAMNELGEDEPADQPGGPDILGDIVISLERAKEQSVQYGHSLAREVGFLTAHGLMHLLGFEHETEAGDREMQAWQEKILQAASLER